MIKKFLRWLLKKDESEPQSPDSVDMLLGKLALTREHEIACDDVHAVLAEFTEMSRRGEDVAHLMPHVQRHLALCPDCREEYEALMAALDAEAELMG